MEVLQNRDFRLVWGSGSLMWLCRWVEWVFLGLLVLELTDSPFQVALVGVFYWLPVLLFSVFAGVLVDRVERWRVLVVANLTGIAATAVLLAIVAADAVEPWHVFVGALVLGWTFALDWTARGAVMFDLVGPGRITRALSMQTMSFAAGSLIGPLIGGLLVELIGFQGPFVFLLAAYVTALALTSQVKSRLWSTSSASGSPLGEIAAGVRYTVKTPMILGVALFLLVSNFVGFSPVSLFPVIARDHLHVGPGLTGVLVSAQGIGSLAAGMVLVVVGVSRYQGRVFIGACTLWLCSLLGFGLSPWYPVSFAMLLIFGMAVGVHQTTHIGIVLVSAEPEMRGRALGVSALCIGVIPLGIMVVGAVAGVLGAPSAIWINAVAGLVLLVPLIAWTPLAWRAVEAPAVRGRGIGGPGADEAGGAQSDCG